MLCEIGELSLNDDTCLTKAKKQLIMRNFYDNLPIAKNRSKVAFAPSLEQVTGIGPAPQAWEARILPLNYTCAILNCLIKRLPQYGRAVKTSCKKAARNL